MARADDSTSLKRVSAGSYRSGDDRFSVEQSSGRWLVLDAKQVDDLGLPLTRGPFATLDAARAAIAEAREAPAPTSDLTERTATLRRPTGRRAAGPAPRGPRKTSIQGERDGRPRREARGLVPAGKRTEPPRPEIRTYRAGEGPRLRAFWSTIGLKSLGDDDESLDRLAERNPGLVVVATAGEEIVGTALGGWDGRRGWIYHLGVATQLRRTGLGRRIVHEVERRLRALGCPKVNVIVRDDNSGGARFWEALGYSSPPARQFGKEL
jgi:GNAT superfamily N-acetyltransferase